MQTTAVRLYGKRDLRLETFELPELPDDGILAEIVSDSVCMSTYKTAEQGNENRLLHLPEKSRGDLGFGHNLNRILALSLTWFLSKCQFCSLTDFYYLATCLKQSEVS